MGKGYVWSLLALLALLSCGSEPVTSTADAQASPPTTSAGAIDFAATLAGTEWLVSAMEGFESTVTIGIGTLRFSEVESHPFVGVSDTCSGSTGSYIDWTDDGFMLVPKPVDATSEAVSRGGRCKPSDDYRNMFMNAGTMFDVQLSDDGKALTLSSTDQNGQRRQVGYVQSPETSVASLPPSSTTIPPVTTTATANTESTQATSARRFEFCTSNLHTPLAGETTGGPIFDIVEYQTVANIPADRDDHSITAYYPPLCSQAAEERDSYPVCLVHWPTGEIQNRSNVTVGTIPEGAASYAETAAAFPAECFEPRP